MSSGRADPDGLPLRRVVRTWWPLAASWVLMGLEWVGVSAFVARLTDPEIHLAAYGGIVFPLSLMVQAPVVMLLATSTALSKDRASYRQLRRYMMVLGGALTVLHMGVAFTPLYYVVVEGVLRPPSEVIEPARLGLMIMTPYTWSIAFRRLNQGVLIRYGRSSAVGLGTLVRLLADWLVLAVGYLLPFLPGTVVASAGLATGAVVEAIYVGLCARSVIRKELEPHKAGAPSLALPAFLRFYVPLAMTSVVFLLLDPSISAALSRMPLPLDSLAVWPVLAGLMFLLRSPGLAYQEVVVALLDEQNSVRRLRLFAGILAVAMTAVVVLLLITPLAGFWFGTVSGLSLPLASLGQASLRGAVLIPGLCVFQNLLQGILVHSRRTRGITEAVGLSVATTATILVVGVLWGQTTGATVGVAALGAGNLVHAAWLWWRSRRARQALQARDALLDPHPAV